MLLLSVVRLCLRLHILDPLDLSEEVRLEYVLVATVAGLQPAYFLLVLREEAE